MKRPARIFIATLCAFLCLSTCQKRTIVNLDSGFRRPPAEVRPWVYWFWLNGNITHEGITADLEAMKAAGIGGVLIMEVDQGTPKGPVSFAGREWRELFKFVCAEANRLGLEVNMNNDAGWCGSGGPWITPDLAMQKVVFSKTDVQGAQPFDAVLPQPKTIINFYRDIAVWAFPTPQGEQRIEMLTGKSALVPQHLASPASWPDISSAQSINRERLLDLTARMDSCGRLRWNVPNGNWTILRFGYTPTGKDNHPAPDSGRGLESDKLSQTATDSMFNGLMKKLINDAQPLVGKTLVSTHIDSWETGSQNWTPAFGEAFQKRRGYDLLPFLPVLAGYIVESVAVSERFLWDVRQTVSDLLIENYAGRFRELAHENGLRLSIEAYDDVPCSEMEYAGQADEPMAEFWSWGNQTPHFCTEMTSAAHVYGKQIIGAEAFTATDGEKWLLHPGAIKGLGDWAFCEGINRFVFHRYAHQPWLKYAPGMSMGPWGLHYERTQTWWEPSSAWHEYLSRCQFLLQRGLFVADICYLQPEGSPRRFIPTLPGYTGNTPERPCYNFDGITPEALLNRIKMKEGRLMLPDGTSYRLLVLPQVETMTPVLLKKIKTLIQDGATILGPPPKASPSLVDYPQCDEEVRKLAQELWGSFINSSSNMGVKEEHRVGKGRVIWDETFKSPLLRAEQFSPLNRAKWIWYAEGNPADSAPVGKCYFRRCFSLDASRAIASARMLVAADNSFEMWVNGINIGSGVGDNQSFKFDIAAHLQPGENLIAVIGENAHDYPNPAGLIARLLIHFVNGDTLEVNTDDQWESCRRVYGKWQIEKSSTDWKPAMELGPLGMRPFPVPDALFKTPIYVFPKFEAIANTIEQLGVPPDFAADSTFRYSHRRMEDMDVYFVSNRTDKWHGARCAFRISGKTPELWNPLSGDIHKQIIYDEKEGRTFLPLWLEPNGSIFVVFREPVRNHGKTNHIETVERNGVKVLPIDGRACYEPPSFELFADRDGKCVFRAWQPGKYDLKKEKKIMTVEIADLPAPMTLTGAWEVCFEEKHGAPYRSTFDKLVSWEAQRDPTIRYYSGSAVYRINFSFNEKDKQEGLRWHLDLGRVAVMAEVKVNNKEIGIVWKPPFRVEVTEALQPGDNSLQVKVTNLWVNRQIGDEYLPEDSDRNVDGTLKSWPQWMKENRLSPTGRYSLTTWRLWKKSDALIESGLLGPVRILATQERLLNRL